MISILIGERSSNQVLLICFLHGFWGTRRPRHSSFIHHPGHGLWLVLWSGGLRGGGLTNSTIVGVILECKWTFFKNIFGAKKYLFSMKRMRYLRFNAITHLAFLPLLGQAKYSDPTFVHSHGGACKPDIKNVHR